MSFEQLSYKSGILGQGCSLRRYLSKPDMIRCRLPALLVLQLMDLGRWQYICDSGDIYLPAELEDQRFAIQRFHETVQQQREQLQHSAGPRKISKTTHETAGIAKLDASSGSTSQKTTAQESSTAASASLGIMPLNTLIDVWWSADRPTLELAIVRLQQFPDEQLKKRLSRILQSVLEPATAEPEGAAGQADQHLPGNRGSRPL